MLNKKGKIINAKNVIIVSSVVFTIIIVLFMNIYFSGENITGNPIRENRIVRAILGPPPRVTDMGMVPQFPTGEVRYKYDPSLSQYAMDHKVTDRSVWYVAIHTDGCSSCAGLFQQANPTEACRKCRNGLNRIDWRDFSDLNIQPRR